MILHIFMVSVASLQGRAQDIPKGDEWRGQAVLSMPTPTNQAVIRAFATEGHHRRGGNIFADERDDALYSYGYHFPLAVRLPGGLLVNGGRVSNTTSRHQNETIRVLDDARIPYAVVPFDAVGAALFGSPDRSPWPAPWHGSTHDAVADLRAHAAVTVPTNGERWREVSYRKQDGTQATRIVHTLGDCVIRVHESYYVSAVDETGVGRGLYFLTELKTRQVPSSLAEALELLKPKPVRDAERAGLDIVRQGEWYGVPETANTRHLMRAVRAGIARYHRHHILGRDGHHRLTEAIIYRYGPRKGDVYGRGTMRHTRGEHRLLSLPNHWYRIVHNIQGQSYSLGGRGIQFD